VQLASGDARRALTSLEAAAAVAGESGTITADHVAQAVDRALLRYDRQGDEHYDVISAFIKSIRGSDVDAAMHYLARMIEAGRTRASSRAGSSSRHPRTSASPIRRRS
jgi:putative ATPase